MPPSVIDHFHHDYEISVIREMPPSLPVWYYPGASQSGGKDGLLVRIASPKSGKWLAMFAAEAGYPGQVNAVYTCPDPSRLCAVSAGVGVYLSTEDPVSHEVVPLDPILAVFAVPALGRLVLHDFTRIAAYGPKGLAWQTPDLSWDGIGEVRIEGGTIRGCGWNAPIDQSAPFEIDLDSGRCTGGASPSHP